MAKGKTILDNRKVTNVQEWPEPITGKQIQQFLGLTNYFRKYIPLYSTLSAPLSALSSHEGKLGQRWTSNHTGAFQKIKDALLNSSALYAPRTDLPFHVATDASDVGVGAVLYQLGPDDKMYINGFMARALSKSERNYGVTKKELLAIIFAFQKFHQHLWGRRFTLYTDHKALIYIHTQKDLNAMMQKWFDTLLDYDFEVVHLPGLDNVMPDQLSRLFPAAKDLEGVNISDQVKTDAAATTTPHYQKYVRAVRKAYLKDNFMEPPTEEERQDILLKAHLFGHFGSEALVKKIHQNGMHWVNLKQQALDLVSECVQCKRFNTSQIRHSPHRPVHAKYPGDHWAIDLTGPLPITDNGNSYLLVMIDICSRFVILRPLKDKTAESVVKAIIPIFCDFGLPMIVQSDNGKEFVNKVMKRFKVKAGFDHRLITPYHPQGNGAAERTVGTAMMVIKKLVEGAPEHWDTCAPIAQLSINNKVSQRTDATPFSVMFGRSMHDFKDYRKEKQKIDLTPVEINKRISDFQNILFPAIEEKTMQTIRKQAINFDKKHMQTDFPVGSYVMERIHSHFRTKMDPKYEGPYQVVRKTQGGSYVLKNTLGDLMQKNYIASQLIPADGKNVDIANTHEVEAVVAHKQDPKTNKYTYKVKWLNFDESHSTWEPAENFLSDECIRDYWNRIKETPNKGQRKRKTPGAKTGKIMQKRAKKSSKK